MRRFEVGDRVILLDRDASGMHDRFKNGEEYVVQEVDGLDDLSVCLGHCGWCEIENIKLVLPQLTPKFKVGDKVTSMYWDIPQCISKVEVHYNLENLGGLYGEKELILYKEPRIYQLFLTSLTELEYEHIKDFLRK